MEERRRHVRAKPTPAMPAHVIRPLSAGGGGDIAEALDIVDISVSGMAVELPPSLEAFAEPVKIGDELKLRLVLASGTHAFVGRVRWKASGVVGLELVDLASETATAIRRYVGELLERGG